MTKKYSFDWSKLAFASKKTIKDLDAIFIAAPREISSARFTQLVKEWLPKGNIVLGIAKEDYIDGFEGQPHFRTLKQETVQQIVDKVDQSNSPRKIYILHYLQRDLNAILKKVTFKHHLFINGSWHKTFHTLTPYYVLVDNRRSYKLISPFINEAEAREYTNAVEKEIEKKYPLPKPDSILNQNVIIDTMHSASVYSFDHSFQNGVIITKPVKGKYKFLMATYNAVVPFQGYAMHYGSTRETHFSPPHDLNHYDTVHAEVFVLINAVRNKIGLKGTTLFIQTLPCPTCSRMLSQTDIKEIVYENDHSEGYAVAMLESAGKSVRRIVSKSAISKVQ